MWDTETERLGKMKCTKIGYNLHLLSDLLGIIGFYLLLTLVVIFAYQYFLKSSDNFQIWYFSIPFMFAIMSQIMFYISWKLAEKKSFKYNADKNEATWIEDGKIKIYKYATTQATDNE